MCASFRLLGLFTLIPATLLLTVSFFVLFSIRKIDSQGLKNFGYVIAVLLWVAAALILSLGIYVLRTGQHPLMPMMQQMMQQKMQMKHPLMQQQMMNR